MFGILIGFLFAILFAIFSLHPNILLPIIELYFSPDMNSALFIISFFTAFSIFSFLANLLFIPDLNSVVSILPAHRMIINKKAKKLFLILSESTLFSTIFSFAFLPIFSQFYSVARSFLIDKMALVLITFSILFLFSEKKPKKILAAISIWFFAGILGLLVFRYITIQNPLAPLLCGFFGLSTIFLSNKNNFEMPAQEEFNKIDSKPLNYIFGNFLGAVSLLFPGAGMAPIIILLSISKMNAENFLSIIYSATIASTLYSFFLGYEFNLVRNGTIYHLLAHFPTLDFSTIIATIIISISASLIFILLFSNNIINFLSNVDIKKIYLVASTMMVTSVYIQSGAIGLLVMVTALSLSISAALMGVKRTNCLAALIIPTILIYM